MAISKTDPIAVAERERIIAMRQRHPDMGAWALATYIRRGAKSIEESNIIGNAKLRSHLSILSVIRRYDAQQKKAEASEKAAWEWEKADLKRAFGGV